MSMNRRRMLGTGAAALATMALPGVAAAQGEDAGGTVAGGGAVETPLGMIDFGVLARPAADGKVTGMFTLSDFTVPGSPTVLQSTQLSRLGAYNDEVPTARQIIGWLSAGGATVLFLLQVDDAGGPGSGEDTVNLVVGGAAAPFLEGEEKAACDCADYSYSLKGTVVRGDILVAPAGDA
jgi:hypothetical protein